MKFRLSLLLCWLGIHRYKTIDVSFQFTSQNQIKTVQCKICGIKFIKNFYISRASILKLKKENEFQLIHALVNHSKSFLKDLNEE